MAAILNANRFFLRLARTSHVSTRTLHRSHPRMIPPILPSRYNLKGSWGEADFGKNVEDHVDELKEILSDPEQAPPCTGVVPLDTNNSRLFYRNAVDGRLGFIDFSTSVNDNQLEKLAQACQPATFGVKQQDVLDESYRKAGKMDAVDFSTNFSPDNTGIMESIRCLLLESPKSSIKVELHKLNVYGPGSFFKSHVQVNTPKLELESHKMFGSLVVALPTKHEGGTFALRHCASGREWLFNSADLVSPHNAESPRAAFIAFIGDMEHEVTEVKSGYRVTLTYNLYFEPEDDKSIVPSPTMLPIDDTEMKVKNLLQALLNNPEFLPNGGLVGFALSHLYPLDSNQSNLRELGKNLKGTDAAIKRACDSLSLDHDVTLKTAYTSNRDGFGFACLLDYIADIDSLTDGMEVEEGILAFLRDCDSDGLLVYDDSMPELYDEFEGARPILWLRPMTERNRLGAAYVSCGIEVSASLDYVYGEICLVLMVEAYEDRKA